MIKLGALDYILGAIIWDVGVLIARRAKGEWKVDLYYLFDGEHKLEHTFHIKRLDPDVELTEEYVMNIMERSVRPHHFIVKGGPIKLMSELKKNEHIPDEFKSLSIEITY